MRAVPMKKRARLTRGGWSALALGASLIACAATPTELEIVMDTELAEARSFAVDVTSAGGVLQTSTADLTERAPPRRLVLVHRSGALGPVRVLARALDGSGATVAEATRVVTLESGRRLTLTIFLDDGCAPGVCTDPSTCDGSGGCRSPDVAPCELSTGCDAGVDATVDASVDAGALDANVPLDAGQDTSPECELEVCDVPSFALPGDHVVPRPCGTPPGDLEYRFTAADDVETSEAPPYRLNQVGQHRFAMWSASDPDCRAEARLDVLGASAMPSTGRPTDEIRDLDARPGTAFLAGRRGAFAADVTGWHDLRAVGVATGSVATEQLASVVVYEGHAFFGTSDNRNALFRVVTAAPFDRAEHFAIPLDGDRPTYAIGVRLDGTGPLVLGTKDGVLEVSPTAPDTYVARELDTEDVKARASVAVGTVEASGRGAVWAANAVDGWIRNLALGGAAPFAGGAQQDLPTVLGEIRAIAIDDEHDRLWLCGSGGLLAYALPFSDFAIPVGSSVLPCFDLAVDVDGSVWVAGGDALSRFDTDSRILARLGAADGIPGAALVALTRTPSRELWVLSARTAGTVVRLGRD